MPSDHQLDQLSVDERNRLELILMEFDESWQPDLLEEYVRKTETNSNENLRSLSLSELVKIDLQRGWAARQGRLLEDYCRELPALGTPETLDPELILIEFVARHDAEPQLDLGSYESRFPKQFPRVSELFDLIQQSDAANVKPHADRPTDQASVRTSRVADLRETVSERKPTFSDLPVEFGRYRIVRELGSGAMGAVYLAHDTQLDRQVALKTPNFDGVKDEELITRFYREAKAAAKLQHRNICPIYDVGEIDGRHFITMAFIKGRCLSEFISSTKRPPVKTAAILILRLATALAEAHNHNVVHRDLKPANIMVDLKKEPVVMDFGLARQTDVESRVTQSGMMVGTPAYMSPEQITGNPHDVGPQADIYSLGVIFYELLTGQLPFRGTIAQVVHQITTVEATPPSQIRSEIDPELEAICGWMMAKDRWKRFLTMDEVAEALRKYLKTPNVKTDAEVSQKYQRASLISSKPLVFKPAGNSPESPQASTYALQEYFGSEEAADPTRTAVESAPESQKPLPRIVPEYPGGIGYRKLILTASFVGGFLLLLGILIYFNGGQTRLDPNTNTTTESAKDGSVTGTPGKPNVSSQGGDSKTGNPLPVAPPTTPKGGSNTKDAVDGPHVLPLTELNIGDYNTSPWPSQDGLRIYWEGKESAAEPSRTVTRMASRFDRRSDFGPSKIVAQGRMATVSPDELEIVCVPNDGRKSLHIARRKSPAEPFGRLEPLAIPNEPVNPKSPSFSTDGLKLVVQSGPPENNEFLISTRQSLSSGWSPFRQFGGMSKRYLQTDVTWPFLSDDGLRIWYGNGGDRKTEIWTASRQSTDDAFGDFKPVVLDGKPLVGRAPRYVASTHELFFARPAGINGWDEWQLAVMKNYMPDGHSEPGYQTLFNGSDLSGWTVIGYNGWTVENGDLVGRATPVDKGWLMSDGSYGNFELKLEYRLTPGSNSGVFLRAWPEGAVNGADFHEIQLLDDSAQEFQNLPANRRTGALFKQTAPFRAVQPEPDQWHQLTILLQGQHLQVSIDGQQVTNCEIPQDKPARGHIGLQLYPKEVRFRNIRIKDLD